MLGLQRQRLNTGGSGINGSINLNATTTGAINFAI